MSDKTIIWNEEPALDLTNYVFKRTRSGMTFFGTWVLTENGHRPCLAIIREGEELNEHTVPCVLTVDKAYAFDQFVGNAAVGAAIMAGFLERLRLEPTKANTFFLFSAINNQLDDLLSIPPYRPPEYKTTDIGVLTINSDIGSVEKVIKAA